MKISAILLAAGESTRMGSPKPLLDWFGMPLVQSQIDSLLDAGVNSVFVVTGHRAYEVREAIKGNRVQTVVNPNYKEGKSTSVKAGLAALPDNIDAIVLLAVDQPRPSWLIKQVLDAHMARKAVISCPRYEGHGGHPLIFDVGLMLELDRISEHSHGVRAVMRNHSAEINWVETDSPVARLDMNTSDAYEAARDVYAANERPAHDEAD
ncbi:MAG: nucleotidyltransferase family protein [Chloroflexi bacterium]|nr:nucleotidyltransferase family protein [Chloroflexota bacterium]